VKCFLQNEKYNGIGEAKKNRRFRQAVRACRNYLSQEIESIQPKLVVAVGKEAAVALERLKYEGQLKYAGQLVRVDHPAWGRFGKQANKRGRLLELCRKVKALEEEGRLIDVLPGCRFIEDP
jgi:uracil-DNA glycosylase